MISRTQNMLTQEPDPRTQTIEYIALVQRVSQLKGRFNSFTSALPNVVYMSKSYWNLIKEIVSEETKEKKDELKEGAILVDRFEGLIVIKVNTEPEFKFLQVGNLFDSQLTEGPKQNTVPSRI